MTAIPADEGGKAARSSGFEEALRTPDAEPRKRSAGGAVLLRSSAVPVMDRGTEGMIGQGESPVREETRGPHREPDTVAVLRQLLAEERACSDQLLEAVTAWQRRARQVEEQLLALTGAGRAATHAPTAAAPPTRTNAPQVDTATAGAAAPPAPVLPPAPVPSGSGDPVSKRHPLYRGHRYQQLVNDFTEEARAAQRQYAALASRPERTRKDEIALGLLDAEWAALGGSDWPMADPRWLAAEKTRFEYRFEVADLRREQRVVDQVLAILVAGKPAHQRGHRLLLAQ